MPSTRARLQAVTGRRQCPSSSTASEPEDGWSGAVMVATIPWRRRSPSAGHLRKRDVPLRPLLIVIRTDQVGDLLLRDDLFDDFCVLIPLQRPEELAPACSTSSGAPEGACGPTSSSTAPGAQPRDVSGGRGRARARPDLHGVRAAALPGRPPGKVFTRETLLSRVWGYEYYGGARTVDVHIRRLRAKLGEEHAHLIQTVRSVGYRFGQAGWQPGLTQRGGAGAGTGT
jgi:hypothetical protein